MYNGAVFGPVSSRKNGDPGHKCSPIATNIVIINFFPTLLGEANPSIYPIYNFLLPRDGGAMTIMEYLYVDMKRKLKIYSIYNTLQWQKMNSKLQFIWVNNDINNCLYL